MIILLAGLFIAAIALAVYAFIPSGVSGNGHGLRQSNLPVPPLGDTLAKKLEEQTQILNSELDRLRQEHEDLNKELELANKIVFELKIELDKLKNLTTQDNSLLKEEILSKSRQLEIESAEVAALNNDIKSAQQDRLNLENDKKALADKVTHLEQKISEYTKEMQAQKEALSQEEETGEKVPKEEFEQLLERIKSEEERIEGLNKQNVDLSEKIKILESQNSEYNNQLQKLESSKQKEPPKEEFESLSEKLKSETEKLDLLRNENSSLVEKIKDLESESAKLKKDMEKQSSLAKESKKATVEGMVLQKDYDELKKKLESAEEILRIVHGAGT